MAEVGVIDLTVASPEPDTPTQSTSADTQRKSRKERRKKEAKLRDDDSKPSSHRSLKRKTPDTASELPPDPQRRKSLDKTLDEDAEQISPAQDNLFFVDVEPTPVPLQPPTQPEPGPIPEENTLLLPAHVTVFGSTPVEIIAPTSSLEDDSIQFLDYDDAKELVRYYENPAQKTSSRIVCKKCGAENEHKSSECTVVICLTCGVRDEHPTRSCPISKVCFNCGMKGHISAKCPNRYSKGIPSSRFMDCERCYSTLHKTNECPTWWRMYIYLSDQGKAEVMSFREERQHQKLGEGGEGYVANDEWCYNCAGWGHWGDDCPESARFDRPQEPSAFGFQNVASGPFYDPAKHGEPSSRKQRPRWSDTFMDLEHVPDDVGRMGKEKAKSRLGKALKDRVAADDDPDDWFSRAGKPSDKKAAPPAGPRGKTTFNFSQSFRDRRDFQPSGGSSGGAPSLLSRLGDTYQDGSKDKPYQGYQGEGLNGSSSSPSKNRRKRDRKDRPRSPERTNYDGGKGSRESWRSEDHRRDNRHNRDRSRQDGPRYRGSYNR